MSISLTSILQRIQGMNTFFRGPNAGRETGVVLEDSATVTWTTDGYGNIQATAAGGSAPTGAENLVYATPNGASGSASLRALVSADLPAGSTGALVLLQTITATGSQEAVTFSAIPGTYSSLLIIDNSTVAGPSQTYQIQFNGDTGENYISGFMLNSNNAVVGNTTVGDFGNIGAVGVQGSHEITIPAYASANVKSYQATSVAYDGDTLANFLQQSMAGIWNNTAAITSVTISNAEANFNASSVFKLYGIS